MAARPASLQRFKDQGNQALKAGETAEAIFFYTKAIDEGKDDEPSARAVYYNNRAIASLKLNKAKDALNDATEALTLNPSYRKAFVTKGGALHSLGNWEAEVAAYTAGLEACPGDVTLTKLLEEAKKRLASGGGGGGAASGGAGPQDSSSGASSAQRFPAPTLRERIAFFLHVFIILNAVGYVLPLGDMSYGCWTRALFTSIASFGLWGFSTAPKFACSMEFAARMMFNPAFHYLFMCMLFLTARPSFLYLIPLILGEVGQASMPNEPMRMTQSKIQYFASYIVRTAPSVAAKAEPLTNRLLTYVTGRQDFAALDSTTKWNLSNDGFKRLAATTEVIIGISLVFSLLTPARNILLLLMFWQTLQIRYMASPSSKLAFSSMHAKILGLTQHRFCPSLAGVAYVKISSFLHSMAQARANPGAGGAGGGGGMGSALSKCSIM